jgi:hypothetical protein
VTPPASGLGPAVGGMPCWPLPQRARRLSGAVRTTRGPEGQG